MDLYSRRIVAWELQDHMRETLVLAALRAAITTRQPSSGLIHHSDRGGQYAGGEYRQVLARARMRQSMSRAADCWVRSAQCARCPENVGVVRALIARPP